MTRVENSHDDHFKYSGMFICKSITPAEYKKRAGGLKLFYGFHTTPFGECLIAVTEFGICSFQFVLDNDRKSSFDNLKQNWIGDYFERRNETTAIVRQLFNPAGKQRRLHLLLKGTDFQIQVWKALLSIPIGTVISYQGLAKLASKSKAVRATANAVANNQIGYIVPCHRVIKKNGEIGGYRWGSALKKTILKWEIINRQSAVLLVRETKNSFNSPLFSNLKFETTAHNKF